MKREVIVIGAGPAGLMAAVECTGQGADVLVLEKMHLPALKLRISGKGRCNLTNNADKIDFIKRFGKNGRFLKYAFAEFSNRDLVNFFGSIGVPCKLERGGRYFPESDSAVETAKALLKHLKSLGVRVETDTRVINIGPLDGGGFSVAFERGLASSKAGKGEVFEAGKVILATGGKSYPRTGSTGDGYRLAGRLGHTVVPPRPSLVALVTRGKTAAKLQGLSLKNVMAGLWCNGKMRRREFGEMFFTDFGLSGPIILTLSREAVPALERGEQVLVSLDLKPALDHRKLDSRLLREIEGHAKRGYRALLKTLLPGKLIPVFIELTGISGEKPLGEVSAVERKRLRLLLKDFSMDIKQCQSIDKAIITAGGVSVGEINPQTMESRLVKGLHFAGEIIDVDADTGGYNLQAAFSTGCVAGRAVLSARCPRI